MINSRGSGRGRRGRRRIVVLVSLLTAFGIANLGSAGSASAAFTLCKGSLAPKSKGNPGRAAKISFSCNGEIRAYGVVSNKQLAGYTDPLVAGSPSAFFSCEGGLPGAGFGCGVKNRAEPGTQSQGSTGSSTSCGRSTTVLAAGPQNNPPAVNNITGPPCIQKVPAGNVISQDVTLQSNPCNFKPKDPLRVFVTTGGEPPVSSFTVRGDSYGVGEYTTEPFPLKVKGYSGCQPSAPEEKKAKKGATAAAAGQDAFNVLCGGKVEPKDPAKPGIDMKYDFACNADIRAYTITSNKLLDFFGFESEVYNPNGTVNGAESALIQCEGPVPGFGFGCGITNRQTGANKLSAGNTLRAELGVPISPCKHEQGEAKLKIWLTVMGEPVIPNPGGSPSSTTGEFLSEPFQLPLVGFDKKRCPEPESKGGSKK